MKKMDQNNVESWIRTGKMESELCVKKKWNQNIQNRIRTGCKQV